MYIDFSENNTASESSASRLRVASYTLGGLYSGNVYSPIARLVVWVAVFGLLAVYGAPDTSWKSRNCTAWRVHLCNRGKLS